MKKRVNPFLYFITAITLTIFVSQNTYAAEGSNLIERFFSSHTSSENKSNKNKIIYLTFDDGPSILTNNILDILDQNDVKGTFFLIGNQIDGFEDVLKRMVAKGHGIGLHTYTHKFKHIYRNQDNFIQEMLDCRNKIKSVTGSSPNVIRFPGGSRKHLNEEFLSKLHTHNFKIYDWNIQTSDGINPKTSPRKLFKEAIKEVDNFDSIILLMHCDYMHKNTCKALPDIIKHYKDHGYEFRAITDGTQEIYFPFSKKVDLSRLGF